MMVNPISMISFLVFLVLGSFGQDAGDGRQEEANRPSRRRQSAAGVTPLGGDLPPGEEFLHPMEEVDVTCKQRNKCSKREGLDLNFYDQNCFCDNLCKMYGDCCKDFHGALPSTIPTGFRLAKRSLACRRVIPIDQTAEIYRVEKCPGNYQDAFVREKCEDAHSLDQFLEIPVSGVNTGVLYKNYYCAVCAGDTDIAFWNVKWQCETGPMLQNMTNTEQLLDDVWIMGAGNCIYEFTHPTMTYRKCKSHLSRCPKFWEGDKSVEKKCRDTTAYTYVDNTMDFMVFGNEFCAQCYGINTTYLTCKDPRGIGVRDRRPPTAPINTFSILLDIPTGTGLIQTRENADSPVNEQQVTFRQCEEYHVYDPFNKICRRVTCPPRESFVQGDCLSGDISNTRRATSTTIRATTKLAQPSVTLTTRRSRPRPTTRHTTENFYTQRPRLTTPRRRDYVNGDIDASLNGQFEFPGIEKDERDRLLDCPLRTFTQGEYTTLKNRSILILSLQEVYDKENYILKGSTIYVCTPLNGTTLDWTVNGKLLMFQFDRIQKLVCMIGLLISLLFLFICLVVHIILPPIRTVPGKCIIAMAVNLFIGHGILLLTIMDVGTDNDISCMVLGIIMHYTFVATFCWTNCLAVDLSKVFGSSRSNLDEKHSNRYISYSVYSWLFPALLVGACVALDLVNFSSVGIEDEMDRFRPYYGDGVCWISRRNGLLFLFAAPLGILFLVNIITFIVTVHNMYTVPVMAKAASRRDKDKNRFLLYIKYSLVLALTWTFALLAVLLHMHFLWYVFIVFLSLQGSFICAAFVCTRKVFRLLRTIGRVHKSSNSNTNNRPYHRAYSNATGPNNPWGYSRSNFLYEGMDAKIVSQETSI